jgi:hypothetical protein
MKSKDKFEVLFICLLILIGGGLVYIFFADLDDDFFPNIVKNLHSNSDYQIIDKIEECSDGYEEIYRDTDNIYYFECNKINFIYLEWEDGSITNMKDELNSGNVNVESLIKHGLDCKIKRIEEENETISDNSIEVENATENKTDED